MICDRSCIIKYRTVARHWPFSQPEMKSSSHAYLNRLPCHTRHSEGSPPPRSRCELIILGDYGCKVGSFVAGKHQRSTVSKNSSVSASTIHQQRSDYSFPYRRRRHRRRERVWSYCMSQNHPSRGGVDPRHDDFHSYRHFPRFSYIPEALEGGKYGKEREQHRDWERGLEGGRGG